MLAAAVVVPVLRVAMLHIQEAAAAHLNMVEMAAQGQHHLLLAVPSLEAAAAAVLQMVAFQVLVFPAREDRAVAVQDQPVMG